MVHVKKNNFFFTIKHSDNYIEANSMQTPASMEKNNILIFILLILIINRFFAQICINMFYAFSFLLYIFLFIKDGNNLNLNKESLFKLVKEYETDSKFNFKLNFESFKELSNGIFQAEGHIGGYFVSKKNNKFRLLIYIGLTVNIESILFFVYLNKEFEYKMNYSIEKLPSDKFYIKLYSRDWKLIIDKIIPYFNNVYGDKYKGLKRLEKIYYLQSEYNNKEKNDEKIILLAYHLVDNSKRKLLIKDRFSLFKISPTLDVNFFFISENNKPLNFYFLLGFILGDGNIYVRIRESENIPWFIPCIRINQKITEDNLLFLKNIQIFLHKENINSYVYISRHLIYLSIEGIINIEKFIKLLTDNSFYWFWKKKEYLLLKKALLLMKLAASKWQKGKEILLNLVYSIVKYEKPIDYWQNILFNYYKKNKNNKEYYISLWREKAWAVKLPIKIKPKVQFFFFKTYESKEKALKEAIKYRDFKLNNWLKENELI